MTRVLFFRWLAGAGGGVVVVPVRSMWFFSYYAVVLSIHSTVVLVVGVTLSGGMR